MSAYLSRFDTPSAARILGALCAESGGVVHIAGAIDLVRGVDHRSDIQQRHAPLAQVVVNVVSDRLWLPSPGEVVADEVRLTNQCLFDSGWPRESDGAQLSEVGFVGGSARRDCRATEQRNAGDYRDGKPGPSDDLKASDSLSFWRRHRHSVLLEAISSKWAIQPTQGYYLTMGRRPGRQVSDRGGLVTAIGL
jgi:hypothetical protein